MCYLYQFARIMGFCFLGEILHEVLPLPVPASIYGLILLLAALKTGLVKLASAGRTTQSFSRRKQSSSGDQETEQEEAR